MSLITRLLNKAPPEPASESVAAGKPSNPGEPNRALSSEERQAESLRVAAVANLAYGDALLAAAADASSPSVQSAAQQRLMHVIESGGVTDPEIFSKLAIEGPSTRVRQLAAEQVEDPMQLRKLLKKAQGKDKNVFKIVKRKCDAINAQQRQAEEAHAAVIALGEAIERHSFRPFDGAFLVTLDHFNTQWNAVADQAPEDLRVRVANAIERGREVIGQHLQQVAAQAAQASAIENADAQRRAVLDEMRKQFASLHAADTLDPAASGAVTAQLTRWSERWQDASRYKPATAVDTEAFDSLRTLLPQVLEKYSKHGTLRKQLESLRAAAPDADAASESAGVLEALAETLALRPATFEADALPIVAEAETLLHDRQKARSEKDAAAANALRQLGGLIRKATRALDDGQTAQANGLRRAIAESIAHVPAVPRSISAPLEQLDLRLGELQDWKSFVVAPKRAQLIERMEALIGSQEPPTRLAEQIKKLQEEWKSISKGGAAQSEQDWERFHRAAQTAYLPCREYFAAQSRVRQENLEKRKLLVADLVERESSTDWDSVNWNNVAKGLRAARQDWRNLNPTERAATKPVQEAFDAVVGRIQARLDAQYAANVEHKRSLIQQAEQLLAETDTRKAIDAIKRLQSNWKSVGLVPHFEDQRLWEAFRQHCDAVYNKSKQEYTQLIVELDVNKTKALALCAEAEQLASATGAALLEGAARLKQLREEFRAAGDLPRAEANEIIRRFERALERFDAAVVQQRTRAEGERWENLLAASDRVRQLQMAVVEAGPDSAATIQSLRDAARAFIDAVPQWPKGGKQALESKLASAAPGDVAANEAALRLLCIRAEILTETPTPAADQQLRRNYQLQSLVQGMGKGRPTESDREQMEAMLFEWIAVGATPAALHEELLQRFQQCWVKARGRNSSRR